MRARTILCCNADGTTETFKVPLPPPSAWKLIEYSEDGASYFNETLKLQAIITCSREQDGKMWLHVSGCRRFERHSILDAYLR